MKIRVAPRARTLRPDILGSTLGLIFGTIVLLFSCVAWASGESIRLVEIFAALFPFYQLSIPGVLIGVIWGYLAGLILGLLIGNIYSFLVRRKSQKNSLPVLEIDPDKTVTLVQRGDVSTSNPYTIAIVANPVIYHSTYAITEEVIDAFPDPQIKDQLNNLRQEIAAAFDNDEVVGHSLFVNLLNDFFTESQLKKHGREIVERSEVYRAESRPGADGTSLPATFSRDPLINKGENLRFFAQGVSRILRALAENELLGLPKIMGPMRILLIYEKYPSGYFPDPADALCESLEPDPGSEAPIIDLLAPRLKTEVVRKYVLSRMEKAADIGPQTDPDVVFVLSASEELTRSAATFSVEELNAPGCGFAISNDYGNLQLRKHAFVAQQPGVAAISLWDDRLKTPIHEFAHAMSSYQNGPIVDEYIDGQGEYFDVRVNKKFLPDAAMPIPRVFTHYGLRQGGVYALSEYLADRENRDKPDAWRTYSAGRAASDMACIMDIAHHGYRFDRLLFDFIYDRLMSKIRRGKSNPCQIVNTAQMSSHSIIVDAENLVDGDTLEVVPSPVVRPPVRTPLSKESLAREDRDKLQADKAKNGRKKR